MSIAINSTLMIVRRKSVRSVCNCVNSNHDFTVDFGDCAKEKNACTFCVVASVVINLTLEVVPV